MTEREMVGWHHQLDGHEFEQAPGDGIGWGSLACCSPWGCKETDTTEQPNNNRGQGPEVRCQRLESVVKSSRVRGQRSEVGSQGSEGRWSWSKVK